jgi:hypothetical protein
VLKALELRVRRWRLALLLQSLTLWRVEVGAVVWVRVKTRWDAIDDVDALFVLDHSAARAESGERKPVKVHSIVLRCPVLGTTGSILI